MGVPAFFRWLSRKYPSVIVECIEQKPITTNGIRVPVNSAEPNPNGIEFDNLYLDMNGIIHPCTHPEDRPAPQNEDEMMEAIFECIDRLFRIVRPRKLLYMAIDGVAPRAKMNQQRSRRFRASKEANEKINEIKRIRSELSLKGASLPPEKPKEEHFDSNCITPGTPFMARLSKCLHYYIHDRLNNDPGWRNIKVILSDANVPGEGEHKIMDFIRRQRAQPDHDPNTQHVLCGADADLIMLGLATHEPNFTIIREEFKPNKPKPCDICGQLGHEMQECTGAEPNQREEANPFGSECQYIFVRLNVLREYLERELQMPNLPFKYDFERVIDDWVFMCFFVGNDFLPHLPSLEIREGAIDRLVNLYKKTVYKTGGFLTDSGDVNLDRVQLIMSELGDVEDEIFKKRQQNELAYKQREKDKKRRLLGISNNKPKWIPTGQFAPTRIGEHIKPVQNARYEAYQMRIHGQNYHTSEKGNAKEMLESMIRPENSTDHERKRKSEVVEDDSDDDQSHDEVRLWEDGFKDRYYESKFDVSPDNLVFRNNVALQYVRGLCWVLRYYYQGCASWKWYFPYHYAPFASDFINIGGLSTEFEKGTIPFRPLEQLMGVFPAASSKHVPAPWAKLMSDPKSPIIDFYPEDFKIDLNGKKFAWQGVALLPFVDEKRLFKALEPYYDCLTEAEKIRNVRGDDRLYVGLGNSGYNFMKGLYTNHVRSDAETSICIDGMRGTVLLTDDCVGDGATLPSPINGLLPIRNNKVYCIKFRDPKYSSNFIFPAKKLKGVREPPKVLKPQDFDQMNRNTGNTWKPQIGFTSSTQIASLTEAGKRILGHYTNHNRVPPSYNPIPIPQTLYPQHHGYQSTNYQGGYDPGHNQQAMVPGPWARGYGTPHNYHQRYPEYQQKNNYNVQQYGRNNYQNPQYNSYGSQYNQQRNYSSNYQGNSGESGGSRGGGWRRST
ncbi:5'-3' exoribonuclease 2 [Apis mellifera caucasica]|uniref:5'-3' exoribonuclease n=1 Tax=Apis mellifera TaxID=7460 RepID=A0A7M7R598_APIME|nr:5'-3' exoribonuclease 2 homolog [Apis mellifera]KAG6799210.1 5'-3' exoribonuclease 2 [Apis mellifera caucasica]KAG9433913.1 5'-3' exoribonuclease 2 [Apis mellifera carnica]|eukprot:XP_392371.3 5'-3' exoribonuclease 2 homolog [Apis mellifera]